jgi:hypothetical protein
MEDSLGTGLILYYLPALVFLVVLFAIFIRLGTISRQLMRANETNSKSNQTLNQIQQLLENRKT